MLHYLYARSSTTGTTGYFTCAPAHNPDLPAALAELAGRPLDSFLHNHALGLMLALPPEEINALAASAADRPAPERGVLCALLLEAYHLRDGENIFAPDMLQSLEAAALPFFRHTPMPLLHIAKAGRLGENRRLAALFSGNINGHKPLAADWSEIPAAQRAEGNEGAAFLEKERARLVSALEETPRAPLRETAAKALERLDRAGLLAGPEMRHEASLSPIALLREWHVDLTVNQGGCGHALRGKATAYGRGLSLARARVSCLMEIVERASAYVSVEAGGQYGHGRISGRATPLDMLHASFAELRKKGVPAIDPCLLGAPCEMNEAPLHWLAAEDPGGNEVLAPAQAVFLFCNLDEPFFCGERGSTGLAAGNTVAEARLAALLETLERYAHASTPFDKDLCFSPQSRDPLIRELLADYRARGIYPQFQDITTEFGVPAWRCFVTSRDGTVAQATGSGLRGREAALSALTETPWPYVWARPAPYGQPSSLMADLPDIFIEDLPDYKMPSAEASLRLLESVLAHRGFFPLYVDITRADLGFPVTRAIVPGLEINADFDQSAPPGPRLMEKAGNLLLRQGMRPDFNVSPARSFGKNSLFDY